MTTCHVNGRGWKEREGRTIPSNTMRWRLPRDIHLLPIVPKIHFTCSPLPTVFGTCLPVCYLAVLTFRNTGSSGYDTYGVVDYNGSCASVAAAADEEYRRIPKLRGAAGARARARQHRARLLPAPVLGEVLWSS